MEGQMTDEQINERITEVTGLWDHPYSSDTRRMMDFCSDLNAMHEAEMRLTKEQVREYQTYMYDMACEIDNTCGRWMPYSATARQRAEAFLRTLDKWEESK
jgi:hypothetical protein